MIETIELHSPKVLGLAAAYNALAVTRVPDTVEIVANQMVVLDKAITETAPGGMGFNS